MWFPAPTVSLKPPLAVSAGPITKLFYGCPDNAFQVNTLQLSAFLLFQFFYDLSYTLYMIRS